MILFILYAMVLFNGEPKEALGHFSTLEACQDKIQELKTDAIAHGVTDGGFVCAKVELGKLS